ncbi:MAG: hypothetical protein Q9203_003034 [Teloschistes exilis]
MPIFQEPEQRFSIVAEELRHASPISIKSAVSDASGKTDICDATVPSQLATDTADRKSTGQKRDGSGYNGAVVCTSDRNELMERIKRGESPTWIPSQTVCRFRPVGTSSVLVQLCTALKQSVPIRVVVLMEHLLDFVTSLMMTPKLRQFPSKASPEIG